VQRGLAKASIDGLMWEGRPFSVPGTRAHPMPPAYGTSKSAISDAYSNASARSEAKITEKVARRRAFSHAFSSQTGRIAARLGASKSWPRCPPYAYEDHSVRRLSSDQISARSADHASRPIPDGIAEINAIRLAPIDLRDA